MSLSEKDKRILKEKYKESRRASWGIRTRKRKKEDPLQDDNSVQEQSSADAGRKVSVLRRADDHAEVIATPTQPTEYAEQNHEIQEDRLITVEPVEQVNPSDPPATSEAAVDNSPTDDPPQRLRIFHDQNKESSQRQHAYIQEQLREKIKEQRRATWAGEKSVPSLTTPPKRKQDKGEREFWSESSEPETGISIGIALLVVIGCIGVVMLGVLLGYLLTAF